MKLPILNMDNMHDTDDYLSFIYKQDKYIDYLKQEIIDRDMLVKLANNIEKETNK